MIEAVPRLQLTTLSWHSVAMKWTVRYRADFQLSQIHCGSDYPELKFWGPIDSFEDCLSLYRRWIVSQADNYLSPWLNVLSKKCGMPFRQVSYGMARTLWGSCSSNGNIRLNAKLLYLPARLVRYVLIHELCHTVHMDHQHKFWALVEKWEPQCRELKRLMRKADLYIPPVLR